MIVFIQNANYNNQLNLLNNRQKILALYC